MDFNFESDEKIKKAITGTNTHRKKYHIFIDLFKRTMTPKEKRQIKDYLDLCSRLRNNRFFRETEELKLILNKTATGLHSLQGYDEDLLRSFLVDFRKIVMNEEPTHFHQIANIIISHKPIHKNKVVKIKKRYETILKDSLLLLKSPTKKYDIVDAWMHGQYFHENKDKKLVIKELAVIKKHLFITLVIDLSALAIELARIAHQAISPKRFSKTYEASPKKQEISKLYSLKRSQELSGITKKLGVFLADENVEFSRYEQIRLFLLATGILYNKSLASEILSNHELHIAYTYREKIKLYFVESWLVFKTIVSDRWNQKAGWYWFPKMTKKSMMGFITKYLINTNNEDVRFGAITLIEHFWSKEYFTILEKLALDDAKSIRNKVLDILKKYRSKNSFKIISILKNDKESDIRKCALKLEVQLLIRYDHRKALALIKQIPRLDDLYIPDLNILLKKLDRQELYDLLRLSIEQKFLTIDIYAELIKRKMLQEEELKSLLQNKQWEVRFYALKELISQGKKYSPAQVEEILKDNKTTAFSGLPHRLSDLDKFDKKEILKNIYFSIGVEELEKLIEWSAIDGPLIYEIIGLKSFEKYKKEIRSDLRNGFAVKKVVWLERAALKLKKPVETMQKVFAKYDNFLVNQFRIAALKVILEYGNLKDVSMAKTLATVDSYEIKKLCIAVIKKFGCQKDSLYLLDLAMTGGLYDNNALIAAASLDKSGKYKVLERVLDSHNYILVRKAIAFGLKYKRPMSLESILSLLKCDDERTRVCTVAYINETQSYKKKEKILKDYITKESYCYNVVCWLDRVLYAPLPLRKNFNNLLHETLNQEVTDIDNYG